MRDQEKESEDHTVYGTVTYWATVRASNKHQAMALALAEGEWEVCGGGDPEPTAADIVRANRCVGPVGDLIEEDPARDAAAELLAREVLDKLRGDAAALQFDLHEGLSALIEALMNARGEVLMECQREQRRRDA